MHWVIFWVFLGLLRLHAELIPKPYHVEYIPPVIKYDRVMTLNDNYRNQILDKIASFSLLNYEVYLVKDLGLFFLDSKADWIKDVLKNNRSWEEYLIPLIQKYAKPKTIAIDAGAHIGTHTLNIARAVGPEGMVFAFEPQPKTFCELFMNTVINRAPNIWCYWAALGDVIGEVALPKFHPEVEVTYIFDHTYGDSGNIAPMIALDSLNLTNVSFIKIDVDGCDDIFLDGARETILRNKPVMVMEILGGADIDTGTAEQKQQILNTINKIKDLGYELERVFIHDYLCTPVDYQ